MRPGDGSAREQAASCQRVLGGCANIAEDYATKRYRSNVVNWGISPFILPNLKVSLIYKAATGCISRHPMPCWKARTRKFPQRFAKAAKKLP